MRIHVTNHARKRCRQRGISLKGVRVGVAGYASRKLRGVNHVARKKITIEGDHWRAVIAIHQRTVHIVTVIRRHRE